jgi:hypothetical protein
MPHPLPPSVILYPNYHACRGSTQICEQGHEKGGTVKFPNGTKRSKSPRLELGDCVPRTWLAMKCHTCGFLSLTLWGPHTGVGEGGISSQILVVRPAGAEMLYRSALLALLAALVGAVAPGTAFIVPVGPLKVSRVRSVSAIRPHSV